VPERPLELSPAEARRVALGAQGFLGPRWRGGVPALLSRLGAVQLDTISVLARSHELVAYARLGPVGRAAVERAYWNRPATAFEYWAHAASIIPVSDWPWYAMRRARYAERYAGRIATAHEEVLRRLAVDGPQTARELGGARQGGPWWDWSPIKRAAEDLLATGELVCVERRGWQRIYDLAERAIAPELYTARPPDDECKVALARRAAAALGVGTLQDLADYHRQRPSRLRAVIDDAGLVPVAVHGWNEAAWGWPEALAAVEAGGRSRTTLLSPFDSLVWDRRRTERIFGFRHRLEAYVPAERRVHGYFTMPVLAGGRLVGRVDPVRRDGALVARSVFVERASAVRPITSALVEAARWVGASAVTIERIAPSEHEAPMREALRAATRAT
jgi:uncharacterized protein YcaQ